jgi:murein DD-endopeptidase MepM/ murein hydrolase activator NlpD
VIRYPELPDVLDLTLPADQRPARRSAWSIGRYDEDRVGMYVQALFDGGRTLHVGVDLGGPVGEPVYAFDDGVVTHVGYNPAPGDYGHVVVTEHVVDGAPLWVLLGHLSASVLRWRPGDTFGRGDALGHLGDVHENGGWEPHVHVQLSVERPATHDLPGVVQPRERDGALRRYPDPRRILGPLY